MKRILTAIIEEGSPASATVKAFKADEANIHIKAASVEEALQLIPGAERDALEACKNWTPEEAPQEEEPQQHYIVLNVTREYVDEYIAEFEASKKGARFIKSIEKGAQIRGKKERAEIGAVEWGYFMALAYKDAFHGLLHLYNWAFGKGYKRAIADRREKTGKGA